MYFTAFDYSQYRNNTNANSFIREQATTTIKCYITKYLLFVQSCLLIVPDIALFRSDKYGYGVIL